MARIAIIHPKFDTKGGAEVVCFNVLEALQDDHELYLFSFDSPDIAAYNEFCGTDVQPLPTWSPDRLRPAFERAISGLARLADGQLGNVNKVRTALLNPLVRRRTADFDLRVSTGGEMALPAPTLQYIHLPIFHGRFDDDYGASGLLGIGHDWVCSKLAGIDHQAVADATLLANSAWTATVFETRYGVRPEVVYPPVNVDEFYDVPWEDRENGFVALGRIAPDKRTLELVRIIEGVRNRGHDVHLHLVGPTAQHQRYKRRVDRLCGTREWLFLEDELDRTELVDLVCTHRYGIHGKQAEHFGIAVAELVAGGTLPFVPDDGGQVELVGEQRELRYPSVEVAIDRIEWVLSDPERARQLRRGLPSMAELGPDRFQRAISDHVAELLVESGEGVTARTPSRRSQRQ